MTTNVPMSIAVADTIMARFPDPDAIPFRPWCYVQGYYLLGFERLWKYTGDARYLSYIRKFVDQHVDAAGDLHGFTGRDLDDMLSGCAILTLYEQTGEQRYRRAAERIRESFDGYPRNSDGGFFHSTALPHQMWIDGVFMGQMFLIRYGAAIGDRDYCLDEATKQILILASHCRKADSGLFLHGYDESRKAEWADPVTGLSPEVWSEGLGWYALVVVETSNLLPTDHPRRAEVMELFQGLVRGLKHTQDAATGLWYQVVDKGDRPDNWHDTSGSAMFTYTLQRAIDLRLIDAAQYRPVVEKGYRGLLTKAKVTTNGLVDIYDACDGVGVQSSYADYINFPKSTNAKEAVGSFLWATSIVEKANKELDSD